MLHDIRKMKKKSDRSYLWEHPFGKRYVPQETKMLQTRSPSFTDDCGHSLQGRPVSPPHKWHLSRRCAETSRQWPTRQAVWAFGHPFGNIKNHNTEKKLDLRSYNVTLQNLLLYINNTNISSCSFARLQSYFLKAESHCTYILMQQGRFFTDFSAQYRALRPRTEIHIWATLGYGNNTWVR